MRQGSSRSAVLITAVSVLVLLVGVVTQWRRSEPPAPAPSSAPVASAPAHPREEPPAAAMARTPARRSENDHAPDAEPFAEDDVSPGTWAALDMEVVRTAMPDNLYWKLAAPTKDPELLRWREEERARWNVEYGKVLSNTGTAEEVDAYFAHRKKLADDYLEFVVHVLTNYGGAIPREGVAMLKLAGELHAARLEELPRQLAEAHARREAHDAARRAWLEEQKTFDGTPSETP